MFSLRIIAQLMLVTALSLSATQCVSAQTLYGSAGSLQARENAHNCDWAYNWGIEPDNNPFDVDVANYEFVPMIWSASTSGVSGQINRILNLEDNFGVHVDYVLGFNEPELPTQSNMTVTQALNVWEIMTDQFSDTDIKLVSPAVSGQSGINNWLTPFMDEVEDRNNDSNPNNDLQVDAIAYHFYTVAFDGEDEADRLIGQIDDLWERYQRPIWITEFAGTSFSLNNPVHSIEERNNFNRDFLDALIPQFDARDYVERVSWWQFGALGRPYSRLSTVSGGVYTPSIIGEAYMRTTLDAGETYDFATRDLRPTYVHYLKGSNIANDGPALIEALRAVDVMESTTIISGTGDFGFENDGDSFVRIRNGATLRKQGENTVTVPRSPISNNGTMLIEDGTLLLEDGTQLTGSGDTRVDSNGTLATSGGIGGDDVMLMQPLTLNRGTLHVQDSVVLMPSQLTLSGPSVIRTDGNLVISGETTGAGAIVATGLGNLFLTGSGSHTIGAQVTEGSLIVANTQASPTGPGNVLVGGNGTLGGFGRIDGDLRASGGAVAPGVFASSSSVAAGALPDFIEGVVVDALDFNFAGVQDDAPLTQTSTLAAGLEVVSGLDFGPSLVPRNSNNFGNEFNVSGFTTSSNWSSNSGDYLTFTVAPVAGLAIQLQDVSFELRRNGVNAPRSYGIFTSIDGFDAFGDGLSPSDFVVENTARTTFTAAYTGNELVTEPIEVRLYGWNSGSTSGNTRFTNVSIDASFVSDPNSVAFDPTGILELGGDYTQLGFATLEIDLGGIQPGEYDQLQVAGSVSLNGTLDVSMIDGFEPAAGQTFDIITADSVTGTFSNIIAPEDMDIQVVYSSSGVSLQVSAGLVGDFDGDNDVDIDDIDFYLGNIGSQADGELALLDFNGDGQITIADVQTHIETHVQTSNGQTGTFFGDFNLDGTVNVLSDAFTLVGNLGNSVSSYADGDANLDGTVDVLGDAFILIGNLGSNNLP